MSMDPAFVELMARLRSSDQAAADEVFRHFARRLITLAAKHLEVGLRAKVDAEDVVQSVFKSFFRRQADDPLRLENWESLWGVLTVITLRKCGRRSEHFRAACRDYQREIQTRPDDNSDRVGWEAIARDPTPAEAAMLAETLEQLLRGLDERDHRIVESRLQGATPKQISGDIGCSERTVERVLERARGRLERMRAEAGED